MASYEVKVVNPRRKTRKKAKKKAGKRKATKRKSTKKRATKKKAKKRATKKKPRRNAKKKATKKKVTKKKASKKKATKKKAKKKTTKKKASKKKASKKKTTKKKASKKKSKKKTSKKAAKKRSKKRGEVDSSPKPRTPKQQTTAFKARRTRARKKATGDHPDVASCRKAARELETILLETEAACVNFVREQGRDLDKTRGWLKKAQERIKAGDSKIRSLSIQLGKVKKSSSTVKSDYEDLEKSIASQKRTATRLRKEVKDLKAQLARAKSRTTAPRKATKKKATKKRASKKATKKRSKKRTARRTPRKKPWPRNVPLPTMTVDEAIHRLSVAGRNMSRFSGQGEGSGHLQGATASGRRMQMASSGVLQLNPLVPIPGHSGLVAQFKSKKATRARAVGSKTPKSVKPQGSKAVKKMTAREKAAIMRRLSRIG